MIYSLNRLIDAVYVPDIRIAPEPDDDPDEPEEEDEGEDGQG